MTAGTRQQRLMQRALHHVDEVKGKGEGVRSIYGGLCHRLPVLIRTCGLCAALAFVHSKSQDRSGDGRSEAHRLLLEHCRAILKNHAGLGIGNGSGRELINTVQGLDVRRAAAGEDRRDHLRELINTVQGLDVRGYVLAQRVLLEALVFHKRFAESVLGVEPGSGDERD
jgi:CRISPR type III-B/RAMP module-associated protein Cmr5